MSESEVDAEVITGCGFPLQVVVGGILLRIAAAASIRTCSVGGGEGIIADFLIAHQTSGQAYLEIVDAADGTQERLLLDVPRQA